MQAPLIVLLLANLAKNCNDEEVRQIFTNRFEKELILHYEDPFQRFEIN